MEINNTPVEPSEDPADKQNDGKRNFLSLHQKIHMVMKAERMVRAEKSMSLKAFCRQHNVLPSQMRYWTKNLVNMKKALEGTTRKSGRVACTTGQKSRLASCSHKLIPWINALRKDGKKVSIRMVATYAKRLDSSLRREKRYTLFAIVRRFCDANRIVMRATTHTAQEDMHKKTAEALAFMETTKQLLHQPNRHQAYIINMDQTPFNPKDGDNKTLNEKGVKTVHGKSIKTSLDRITCMLTVCADGTKLPPLLIFKAKPGGSVEKEFTQFPNECKYAVQENAWTDERVMLLWVDVVLAPYVKTAPKGIVPYLILDKYTCHMQGSVTKKMESLGVECDIVPGGCTGLVQPIDVGIGKPFKNRMRYQLEEWMMDQYTEEDGSIERIKPSCARRFVAKWAVHAWRRIPKAIIKNSWRHKPYSYFPDEPTEKYAFSDEEDSGDDELSVTGI